MKKLILFPILILFAGISLEFTILPQAKLQNKVLPAKTVVLKHPDAADLNTFFTKNKNFTLYIFQCGSSEELLNLLLKLGKDKTASCMTGALSGEYQAIEVSLKSSQKKIWFVNWLKNAGLKTIKINNDQVKNIEQL